MFPPEEYKSAAIKGALQQSCRAAGGARLAGRQAALGSPRKAEEQRSLAAAPPGSSAPRTRRARPFLLGTAPLASTPRKFCTAHPHGCSLGRTEKPPAFQCTEKFSRVGAVCGHRPNQPDPSRLRRAGRDGAVRLSAEEN